jgi:hypothetical protein
MASSQNFSIAPVSLTWARPFLHDDGGGFAGVEHLGEHLLRGGTADGLGFDEADEFEQRFGFELQARQS